MDEVSFQGQHQTSDGRLTKDASTADRDVTFDENDIVHLVELNRPADWHLALRTQHHELTQTERLMFIDGTRSLLHIAVHVMSWRCCASFSTVRD